MDVREPVIPGNGQGQPAGYLPGPEGSYYTWEAPRVELRDYLRILARRRRILFLAVGTVFASAAFYVFTTPPVYRATAKVRVQKPPGSPLSVILGETDRAPEGSSLDTQAKIVQSSILAEQTAKQLAAAGHPRISADEVMGGLRVAIEKPDVLAISVEHTDRDRARLIANAVQQAYIEEDKSNARMESSNVLQFLEKRLPEAEAELKAAEAEVKRVKEQYHIQDLDSVVEMKTRTAFDYKEQAALAQAEWRSARAELGTLRARSVAEPPLRTVQRVVNDPVAEGFRQEMAAAELALAKAQGHYEDSHPQVLAARDRLNELQTQFEARFGPKRSSFRLEDVQEPNPNYEMLRARVAEQESRVASLSARAGSLEDLAAQRQKDLPNTPQAYVELARLESQKEIRERAYLAILGQYQQAQLGEVRVLGAARVLDVARRPGSPIRPRRGQTLVLALIVGLVVGVALALLIEHSDTSLGNPDELMEETGISSLGFLPAARSHALGLNTITLESPRAPISEGFRSIRSNLKFSSVDEPVRTLAVTSAGAGEGKSFTAANLAIVFAQSDTRVILVDADLRRPILHRTFDCERTPGLTDVLAGEADLDTALRPTALPGLTLLPSGPVPPNPSELLHSRRMLDLIETLKQRADIVIFDTPPALVVTDAVILSSRVDGLVVVAEQGRVSSYALIELARLVHQARGKIAGAVLNKVKASAGDYYYYYYYYRNNYYYGDRKGKGRHHPRSLPDPTEEPAALPGEET